MVLSYIFYAKSRGGLGSTADLPWEFDEFS